MRALRSSVRLALATLVAAIFAGCPSYTSIPDGTMKHIREDRDGKLYWLQQSMYVGQFYDDDRYRLLDPHRFEQISYLRTAEGDVLAPPPADGILPAGTRVRVERVAFPTGDNVFRRPLYTPRYTTWVYLRVARDRGDITLEHDRRHVLLLPAFLSDQPSFDQWFDAVLSDDDPNPRIRALSDEHRRGVDTKTPMEGMTYETLTMAMGFPDRISGEVQERDGRSMTVEVAIYGAVSVVLEDGKVVRVSRPDASSSG